MSEQTTDAQTNEEQEFARGWRFDEDGPEVRGKFVKFDVGHTEHGQCPIVVLNVDGEERSVWCFHTALKSKFQQEVNRRDVQVGELIVIKQAGEKQGANRKYMNYVVTFPDAPPVDAKAIFGAVDPIDQPPVAYATPPAELPESKDW